MFVQQLLWAMPPGTPLCNTICVIRRVPSVKNPLGEVVRLPRGHRCLHFVQRIWYLFARSMVAAARVLRTGGAALHARAAGLAREDTPGGAVPRRGAPVASMHMHACVCRGQGMPCEEGGASMGSG